MPKLTHHCWLSRQRTGKGYEDLHRWMDAEQEVLGLDHRFVRHDLRWINYVEEKWGKEGVLEFLQHIIDDYKDTYEKKRYRFECELKEKKI